MWGLVFFSIVGIDPNEAQIRDLAVKINYNGFSSFMHKYGLKSMVELESGTTLNNFNASLFLLLTSPSIIVLRFEKWSEIRRVGDIWIPKAYILSIVLSNSLY